MYSEYKRPIVNKWEENSLVITNANDVLRVIQSIVQDIVVDVKILDDRSIKSVEQTGDKDKDVVNGKGLAGSKRGRSNKVTSSDSDDDSSSDEDSDWLIVWLIRPIYSINILFL